MPEIVFLWFITSLEPLTLKNGKNYDENGRANQGNGRNVFWIV